MARLKKSDEAALPVGSDVPRETQASPALVQPIIHVQGEPHPFEDLEALNELPKLRSIGMYKLEGSRDWVSYVMTSQGARILSIEVTEPNLRAIAEDDAKTSFVRCFMNEDGPL